MLLNTSHFCRDYFWDQDIFWNGSTLQFSQCFRTSIVLIVCAFLWFLCLPWVFWICRSQFKDSHRTKKAKSWLFVAKIIINAGLIALVSWSIYVSKNNEHFVLIDIFYAISFPVSLLLCLLLTIFEKRYHVRSSLVQSIFWPLLLLGYIPTLLHLAQHIDDIQTSEIIAEICVFTFVFCMTILNLFADLSGLTKQDKIAPQQLASYASRLFFGWFEPLVIKGWKSPLIQNDLPQVPDNVEVKENVEVFMKQWYKHVDENGINFASTKPRKRLFLWKPIFKSFGFQLCLGNLVGLFHYSVKFALPLVS